MLNKPKKSFVNYYSVESNNNGYYKLIMEKLYPLSDNECEIIDLILNTLGIEEYMLDDNKRYSFIQELKNNPEYYEDFASFNEMKNMILILKRMYIEAKQIGIKLFDLRCDNIGKRLNGDIVHFDLGSG